MKDGITAIPTSSPIMFWDLGGGAGCCQCNAGTSFGWAPGHVSLSCAQQNCLVCRTCFWHAFRLPPIARIPALTHAHFSCTHTTPTRTQLSTHTYSRTRTLLLHEHPPPHTHTHVHLLPHAHLLPHTHTPLLQRRDGLYGDEYCVGAR